MRTGGGAARVSGGARVTGGARVALLVAVGMAVAAVGVAPASAAAGAGTASAPLRPAPWATLSTGAVGSGAAGRARAAAESRHGPGRILVGSRSGGPVVLLSGASRVSHLAHSGIDVLQVGDVASALTAYRAMGGVAWAEADRAVHASAAPDDTLYPAQVALHPIAATPWGLDWEPVFPTVEGAGALVAVVDSGFREGGDDQPVNLREDLARSFVPGSPSPTDDNGHGTFVANIIAEATNNSTGAAGIAPEATVVPVKVLGADGAGDLSVVTQGIEYAQSIGATVINLSLAGDQSAALCAAVAAASVNAVVVAAAGNDATPTATAAVAYPAACPGAVAVGAIALDGTRPGYANSGCALTVVAPGGDEINLSDPTRAHSDWVIQQSFEANPASPLANTFQYFEEEGTSMASAQVAGAAALLVGMGATASRTRALLMATARQPGVRGDSGLFGAGALDVAAAVAAEPSASPPPLPLRGWRLATATGQVRAVSDACNRAGDQGSVAGRLALPAVGMAATPSGHGYWLVASDGGIFSFGDANFYGSTGAIRLNRPIVGMAVTPSAQGYWMVADDGGIFAFGDANFYGSTGSRHLNRPIVGMVATVDGRGYALAGGDGQVFTFGDAPDLGGAADLSSVVGIAPEPWPGS